MKINTLFSFSLALFSICSTAGAGTLVTLNTTLGAIDIELLDDVAPETVSNFLDYVDSDSYLESFIHRSAPGILIQGGGFTFIDSQVATIPSNQPIANEFSRSNLRGTIAMAYFGNDPNSATTQWHINLDDNSELFDSNSEQTGFTVFGEVTASGMQIVDAIAALTVSDVGGSFTMLPTINYSGGSIVRDNLVMIDSISVDGNGGGNGTDPVRINPGLNGGWFDVETPGQGFLIDVLPDAGIVFLAWFTFDVNPADPGDTAVVGAPEHRWLTAQGSFGSDTAFLDLTVTTGGLFDDPQAVSNSAAGTTGSIQLVFNDCASAELTYQLIGAGLSRTINLRRLGNDNVTLCETLSQP